MRIVDRHISNNSTMLFALYAASTVGKIVALISRYPKSSKGNVILYGELLYTCKEIISELVFCVFD